MPLDPKDAKLLWDMLTAAQRVVRYVAGLTEQAFYADDMRQYAVERGIEIIGEAARGVSDPTRESLPEVAWGASSAPGTFSRTSTVMSIQRKFGGLRRCTCPP